MIIAFDIDGTLRGRYRINRDMHNLLHKFASLGAEIIVWSGGGVDYATHYVETHKLPATPMMKNKDIIPDLVIDDVQTTNMGLMTLYCKSYD